MKDYAFVFFTFGVAVFIFTILLLPDVEEKHSSEPLILISTEQCTIYKITDKFRSIYFSPNCVLSVK